MSGRSGAKAPGVFYHGSHGLKAVAIQSGLVKKKEF